MEQNTPNAPADETSGAPSRSFILPLRIGGMELDMPLTRFEVADRPPPDPCVCYAEQRSGQLVVAMFRGGRWLDRKRKPLSFTPTVWFKIGGGD